GYRARMTLQISARSFAERCWRRLTGVPRGGYGRGWRVRRGWALLRRRAEGVRHGSPLIPRGVVRSPPGAGALGAESGDLFDRWVLLVNTEHDVAARSLATHWSVADISDATLRLAHEAVLDGIALARKISAAHVGRVTHQYKWVLERGVVKALGPAQRRVLEAGLDG